MNQSGHDVGADELREVAAGFTTTKTAQNDLPRPKGPSHEVVQRNASRDQVPSGLSGVDGDAVVSLEPFEGLALNQGDLAIRA